MRYGILILVALFGVVGVAIVRTYQLSADTLADAAPTVHSASPTSQPSQVQNQVTATEIRGTISSISGDLIVINDCIITVPKDAQVRGKVKVKERVLVVGFQLADGRYVARQIMPLDHDEDGQGGD